jgi:formate hydrogenlyase subunit 6/NADH:ubiquinone oxidoreductase subunit I
MFRFFELGVRKRGVVTTPYPNGGGEVPQNTFGAPQFIPGRCDACGECAKVCPTGAITVEPTVVKIDLGLCIFCGECARLCPNGSFEMSPKYELSSKERDALEVRYDVKQ